MIKISVHFPIQNSPEEGIEHIQGVGSQVGNSKGRDSLSLTGKKHAWPCFLSFALQVFPVHMFLKDILQQPYSQDR